MSDGDYLRKKYQDYRAFNPDYDVIGVRCEREVGHQFGVEVDETYYPDKWPGWDCILPGVGKCDAKGSPTPGHLLVERGRVKSKVYILCRYENEKCTELIGWAWAKELLKIRPAEQCDCCPKPTKFRLQNHIIKADALHPMRELHDLVNAARGEVKNELA
jgi:hypothetical protein